MNYFYLLGIASVGETFICDGKLTLIFSYSTRRAWFDATFILPQQQNKHFFLLTKQTSVDPS